MTENKRTITMLTSTWRNWKFHALLVGLSNASTSLKNSLTVPKNVKHMNQQLNPCHIST